MICHLRVWLVSTWCEVELGYGLRAAGVFVRGTEFSVSYLLQVRNLGLVYFSPGSGLWTAGYNPVPYHPLHSHPPLSFLFPIQGSPEVIGPVSKMAPSVDGEAILTVARKSPLFIPRPVYRMVAKSLK